MGDRIVRAFRWTAGVCAACAALAGCTQASNVSMQANVRQQYTHVWLTVQEIWFNTSATASPEDTTWKRFPLSTPITVDLATLTSGSLAQIASSLKVPDGTYPQIRLIPVDSATLASSASAAGAIYNSEVDYTDSSGVAQRQPLGLLNADKGIGVATTLTIKASLNQFVGATTTT